MKKSYFSEYCDFLKNNYPTFYQSILKNLDEKNLIYLKNSIDILYKILLQIDILNQKHVDFDSVFLDESFQLLLRIFSTLPLNDQYILDMLFRSIAEALLRLITISGKNKRLSVGISEKASYSEIKKFIKFDSYLNAKKNSFNYLYLLFSETSYSQHNPKKEIKEFQFINDQFSEYTTSYKNLRSRLNQINLIFLNLIVPDLYDLHQTDLSLADKANIAKQLSNKEQDTYFNLPK